MAFMPIAREPRSRFVRSLLVAAALAASSCGRSVDVDPPSSTDGGHTDSGPQFAALDPDPAHVYSAGPDTPGLFYVDLPVSGAYDFGLRDADGTSVPVGLVFDVARDPSFASPVWTRNEGVGPSPGCRYWAVTRGRVYLRVTSTDGQSRPFRLFPVHTLGVGSIDDPMPVSEIPTASSVDAWSHSIYTFTTGAAGAYRVIATTGGEPVPLLPETNTWDLSPERRRYCTDRVPCILNNLDADTTYVLVVTPQTGVDLTFDIQVEKGLGEGTYRDPIPIPASGIVSGELDPQAIGYYLFDAPVAGLYRVTVTELSFAAGTTEVGLARPYDEGIGPVSAFLPATDQPFDLATLPAGPTVVGIRSLAGAPQSFSFTITLAP